MKTALLLCLFFAINAQGRDLILDTVSLGYGLETHTVVTGDGYILTMHRIPYSKREAMDKPRAKQVYFLMHGMMGTSASFINQGSKRYLGLKEIPKGQLIKRLGPGPHRLTSSAYALSHEGFDVWLGNARGNPYSRAHKSINLKTASSKKAFFNFSWEEIAIFDLPAMIDYILEATGEEKIRFIGDTQGATSFFILNIMKPEYNSKFLTAQLLDPVGYTKYFPSPELKEIANMIYHLHKLARSSDIVEISSFNLRDSLEVTPHFVIQSVVSYIANFGDLSSVGTSVKQLVHYAQNIRDKAFSRWNYGQKKNLDMYDKSSPPLYNLSHVTVYTILYCRKNNMLLDERDVRDMAADMPNAKMIVINGSIYSPADLIDVARNVH